MTGRRSVVASLLGPAALAVTAGALSWRRYARLPVLPPAPNARVRDDALPSVSIIVPARDEERRLGPLLASLNALDYPSLEIVVVDDNSSDGTSTIARAHGVTVIAAPPLATGWTGKAAACAVGAEEARGEWLLFTDADTIHGAPSLHAAMHEARARGLDALSLMTGQLCTGRAQRLLLPLAYAVLFGGAATEAIGSRTAVPLANGQYILCRAAAYREAGGHAHRDVRGSVIEDAALARLLVAHGLAYRLYRAESMVAVAMYDDLKGVWAGFRKNAARYVLDDPRRLPGAALATTAFGATTVRLVRAGARQDLNAVSLLGIILGYGAASAALVPWYRRFGVHAGYALLHPLGALVVAAITVDSTGRVLLRRGAPWKGRSYR